MARKRGEYQRQKEHRNKISNILCILFFLFGAVLMLYGLVQASVNVWDIEHGTLNAYTGEYEYRVKVSFGRHRNTTYVFTLGNGDVVLASKQEIENPERLNDNDVLTFQYTTMLSNPLYGRYSAVSVTSADGEMEFVNADRSRRESVSVIWLSSIFSLLSLSIMVFLLVVSFYTDNWKKRYQNWRKQRNMKTK